MLRASLGKDDRMLGYIWVHDVLGLLTLQLVNVISLANSWVCVCGGGGGGGGGAVFVL